MEKKKSYYAAIEIDANVTGTKENIAKFLKRMQDELCDDSPEELRIESMNGIGNFYLYTKVDTDFDYDPRIDNDILHGVYPYDEKDFKAVFGKICEQTEVHAEWCTYKGTFHYFDDGLGCWDYTEEVSYEYDSRK